MRDGGPRSRRFAVTGGVEDDRRQPCSHERLDEGGPLRATAPPTVRQINSGAASPERDLKRRGFLDPAEARRNLDPETVIRNSLEMRQLSGGHGRRGGREKLRQRAPHRDLRSDPAEQLKGHAVPIPRQNYR